MDVVIVCHTEFGRVQGRDVIYDKNAVSGVEDGVLQLIAIADKYGAKVSFAVCPETVPHFPRGISHEIGLHVHPGWNEFSFKGMPYWVGDKYLKEHCKQSVNSSVLRDYPYEEQLDMIRTGKEYVKNELGADPKIFVAGRWSLNNDTVKALVETGFTHECSAPAHSISDHYDWRRLPRMCMPYHPSAADYQAEGGMPLLMVPVSQTLFGGTVTPEGVITYGLPWLLAAFEEYYRVGAPVFHICLHSPSMTDPSYRQVMETLLSRITAKQGVSFKFASQVKKAARREWAGSVLPYLGAANKELFTTALGRLKNLF